MVRNPAGVEEPDEKLSGDAEQVRRLGGGEGCLALKNRHRLAGFEIGDQVEKEGVERFRQRLAPAVGPDQLGLALRKFLITRPDVVLAALRDR